MNTDSCKILAQNLTDLINKSGRQLIDIHAQAQQAGIVFNYPQLTKLSSIKSESVKNPTIETLEKVVEIFRATVAPDLEMWMLLKEGYFSSAPAPQILDPKLLEQYVNEFLFALTTMKVVGFTKEQYENALNVGKFCSMKYSGQTVMTPELAERKG